MKYGTQNFVNQRGNFAKVDIDCRVMKGIRRSPRNSDVCVCDLEKIAFVGSELSLAL